MDDKPPPSGSNGKGLLFEVWGEFSASEACGIISCVISVLLTFTFSFLKETPSHFLTWQTPSCAFISFHLEWYLWFKMIKVWKVCVNHVYTQ